MYKNKELFDKIVCDIMNDPYFAEFKFSKRDKVIYKRFNGIKHYIALRTWPSYDTPDQLVISPIYLVKFDVVLKWFRRFSVRSIQDQRDSFDEGCSGSQLSKQDEFTFNKNGSNYDSEIKNLIDTMIYCCKIVFVVYDSLEGYYDMDIIPLLNREWEIPQVGGDRVFKYLALCKLVAPENYEKLKSIIVPQFERLYKRGEPNVKYYYPRLNEILSYLENNDIRKG